jgi:hypothetical protein
MFHPNAAEAAVVLINDKSPTAYEGLLIIAAKPKTFAKANGLLMCYLKGKS